MLRIGMNEYSILTYGFKQNHIKEVVKAGKVTKDFHCLPEKEDLYDYVRVEDIDKIRKAADLDRIKLISADGQADLMRPVLNAMDEETFNLFVEYHLATCERQELVGAGAHTGGYFGKAIIKQSSCNKSLWECIIVVVSKFHAMQIRVHI